MIGLTEALIGYRRQDALSDVGAGVITAILLVPQGIAFALLAGLPAHTGLYASILPMLVYALLGSSRTLSVGPVSVAAIMVSSALQAVPGDATANAAMLALEGGVFLWILSVLRVGGLFNLIEKSVLSGFTAGAAILIILSQLPHLIGAPGGTNHTGLGVLEQIPKLFSLLHAHTFAIGVACLILLWAFNALVTKILIRVGIEKEIASAVAKLGPLFVVVVSAIVIVTFKPSSVATVGYVPSGLPALSTHFAGAGNWLRLMPSALFIAFIGYVESIAIGKALAARRGQELRPNRELVALGAANIAAALSATMPVAGGFSRTMVNYSAGARTQIASIVTALMIALSIVFFTTWFSPIPKAALAAIIIVAVAPLVELRPNLRWMRGKRSAALTFGATFLGVLLVGIEQGLAIGIIISLLTRTLIRKQSRAA